MRDIIVGAALQSGQLVNTDLAQAQTTPISIHVVYLPDRSPPAKVREMSDFLVEAFAGKRA